MKRATTGSSHSNPQFPYFNPRPREEGDRNRRYRRQCHAYFNPRPREEGDEVLCKTSAKLNISIHALVKRATTFITEYNKTIAISIHALVKRATLTQVLQRCALRYFNPRPREEGDWRRGVYNVGNFDFNPRPREEGD